MTEEEWESFTADMSKQITELNKKVGDIHGFMDELRPLVKIAFEMLKRNPLIKWSGKKTR